MGWCGCGFGCASLDFLLGACISVWSRFAVVGNMRNVRRPNGELAGFVKHPFGIDDQTVGDAVLANRKLGMMISQRISFEIAGAEFDAVATTVESVVVEVGVGRHLNE